MQITDGDDVATDESPVMELPSSVCRVGRLVARVDDDTRAAQGLPAVDAAIAAAVAAEGERAAAQLLNMHHHLVCARARAARFHPHVLVVLALCVARGVGVCAICIRESKQAGRTRCLRFHAIVIGLGVHIGPRAISRMAFAGLSETETVRACRSTSSRPSGTRCRTR
jgi:hypothetical protein